MTRRSGAAAERVYEFFDCAAQRLTQALLLAIIAIVSAQVFCRFVLNSSLIWSEEVAGWCMVWIVFAGAVSLLRGVAVIFSRLAALAASLFLAWYGARVVAGGFNMISQATGIDTRYVKLCVPVSAVFMAVFAAAHLAADVRRLRRQGRGAVAVPGTRHGEPPLREAGAQL